LNNICQQGINLLHY